MHTRTVERAAFGLGAVRREHEAVGVSYIDVMQRRGQVQILLPSG